MLNDNPSFMEGVNAVITDPLRFKKKLGIGEEAYASLKAKTYLLDALDAGNGAVTGVAIANSSLVASKFFASSGFLSAIGIGAAASTPLGWAVAAGIVGAGLSVAFSKGFVRGKSGKVTVIPDFINTPLDYLATCLFDNIGTLSIKMASIDGQFHPKEIEIIKGYFINDWGYDQQFVNGALVEVKRQSKNITIKEIATQLAEFKKASPDCNYSVMSKELLEFLREIAKADGRWDEREEMAIERVEKIFCEVGAFSVSTAAKSGLGAVVETGKKGASLLKRSKR